MPGAAIAVVGIYAAIFLAAGSVRVARGDA
jgi:hypothetical protein